MPDRMASWRARGIPVYKIIAAYKLNKSTRKVAELLKIAPRTVAMVVRENAKGLLLPVGGAHGRGKGLRGKRMGSFAKWVLDHPDTRLPRDLGAIARMSGCTRDSVKCFMYRQRRQGKAIPYLVRRVARGRKLEDVAPRETTED